ncbi:hypothetical protein BMS3Bbin08_00416 [bacterium BMS3Bbin08]|nr:hypothetical protein BMS3Bbin08_00416 [bacterium BMS3Bbin08]
MINLRYIFSLFIPPTIPKYSEKTRKDLMRDAVKKTTSGNILLQFGRYLSSSDVEELRAKALGHKR